MQQQQQQRQQKHKAVLVVYITVDHKLSLRKFYRHRAQHVHINAIIFKEKKPKRHLTVFFLLSSFDKTAIIIIIVMKMEAQEREVENLLE